MVNLKDGFIRIKESSNKKIFDQYLIKFKDQNSFVSSIYSNDSLNFYERILKDNNIKYETISFLLLHQNNPYFAFIGKKLYLNDQVILKATSELPCLIIEEKDLSINKKKKIKESINEIVESEFNKCFISAGYGTNSIKYSIDYLLTKRKTKLMTEYRRLIFLDKSISLLKRALRKSYNSLINWGINSMEITIFDSDNISRDVIYKFRDLHIKEAGKETRSIETWEIQYQSIKKGTSFCVLGKYKNEIVSAGWFPIANRHCYYGSSVSKRDLMNKPLFHALMWTAVIKAKDLGAQFFETGVDIVDDYFSEKPSKKEESIAKFKSGFGGLLVPHIYTVIEK